MLDTTWTTRPTADEILAWNDEWTDADPQDLLAWAGERWGDTMALTCSFGGAAGMVLLDMVVNVAPQTPILYIDTGLLFGETYALIDQVEQRYGIEIIAARPTRTVAQQAEVEGPALWTRDPNRCCGLRKVQPMADALQPFNAWITGVRRENAATRANARQLEWSNKYNLIKLNPLASWTNGDVWRYINANNVPYNPLLDQGYTSLGCAPCTSRPLSDDSRSGRWVGFNKTECGLHLESN